MSEEKKRGLAFLKTATSPLLIQEEPVEALDKDVVKLIMEGPDFQRVPRIMINNKRIYLAMIVLRDTVPKFSMSNLAKSYVWAGLTEDYPELVARVTELIKEKDIKTHDPTDVNLSRT